MVMRLLQPVCIYVIPERSLTLHYQLVLLCFRVLHSDAVVHADLPDELLPEEVAHLDDGSALGYGAVDGEMSVDGAHLVEVALQ